MDYSNTWFTSSTSGTLSDLFIQNAQYFPSYYITSDVTSFVKTESEAVAKKPAKENPLSWLKTKNNEIVNLGKLEI